MHMKTEKDFSIDLLRHMVLNSIRGYKTKFGNEYGDIVFAIDNKKCWRKQVFQHYKAKRVDDKEKSTVDWDLIYKNLDIIVDEFIEYLPYKVLKIDECEGDDIIAVLTQKFSSTEKILIISTDDDFVQLQKYGNVKQYSPTKKVYINSDDPLIDLKTKILRGDKGDGVPNVLSLDNSFVDGIRQKKLSEEKVNLWVRQELSVFCNTNELQRNYARNKMLIDFDEIQKDVDHILKLKQDRVISKSLEQTIYVTNSSPNDVYAAFDSESRGLIEAKESGCYTTKITLYKGERI